MGRVSVSVAAVALALVTVATRLPLLVQAQPVDDEAVYSVVANEIVDGGKPYRDAVERKPPLLFYTYAAVYGVAGKYNWAALHVISVLWILATMAGLFVIARSLFDVRTGVIAALLYSLFEPGVSFKNLTLNGEVLMNLPIVWAWAIAFGRNESRVRPALFVAGMLSCVAFLLKQPAAIAAVPLGLYFLLPSYRAGRGLTIRDSFVHFATFTAGFWLTLAATALLLQRDGILRGAIYWTIQDHAAPHFFADRFVRATVTFLAVTLPLWLAAAFSRGLWNDKRAEWTGLVLLTIASAIGVVAGGRFYSHYYIQFLPPLTLLAAPLYGRVFGSSATAGTGRFWRCTAYLWLALTLIVFQVMMWKQISKYRHFTETGQYLAHHHRPGERLFVWGQDPDIYLEARMRPATRYVTTFALTGYIFGGPIPDLDTRPYIRAGAWDNLQRDFADHPPAYIVDMQKDREGEPSHAYPIEDFPILRRIMANDYAFERRTAEAVIYRRVIR